MSPSRWAISVLILWHIVALTLRALPSPDLLPEIHAREAPVTDPFAAPVTPILDALARTLRPVPLTLREAAKPIVSASNAYGGHLGLAAEWRMFSNPPVVHEYIRVRYYIAARSAPADRPSWTATELITPAHREDRIRVLKSYRDSTRDKATKIALEQYLRRLRRDGGSARPGTLPDDVAPIVRYFGRRFAADTLLPGERIVRTELWYGTVPITPRGAPGEDARRTARLTMLRRYYGGPIENRGPMAPYPDYQAAFIEGDVRWVLEYFEAS